MQHVLKGRVIVIAVKLRLPIAALASLVWLVCTGGPAAAQEPNKAPVPAQAPQAAPPPQSAPSPAASPVTVPYSMFNTACWDPVSGTAYTKQPITEVSLILPGGPTAGALNVQLISLKEN